MSTIATVDGYELIHREDETIVTIYKDGWRRGFIEYYRTSNGTLHFLGIPIFRKEPVTTIEQADPNYVGEWDLL